MALTSQSVWTWHCSLLRDQWTLNNSRCLTQSLLKSIIIIMNVRYTSLVPYQPNVLHHPTLVKFWLMNVRNVVCCFHKTYVCTVCTACGRSQFVIMHVPYSRLFSYGRSFRIFRIVYIINIIIGKLKLRHRDRFNVTILSCTSI